MSLLEVLCSSVPDPDPEPALFRQWPSRCQQKIIILLITFRKYYFLKEHYIILHRYKFIKKSLNSRNHGFSGCFFLMIEGYGSEFGIPKTYGSYGFGSGTLACCHGNFVTVRRLYWYTTRVMHTPDSVQVNWIVKLKSFTNSVLENDWLPYGFCGSWRKKHTVCTIEHRQMSSLIVHCILWNRQITNDRFLCWNRTRSTIRYSSLQTGTQLGKKGAADLFKLELHWLGILLSDHLGHLFSDIEGFILKKNTKILKNTADPHHFNADPDPAFHLNMDPDPSPHQSAGKFRTKVYRPSRAPFSASRPPFRAFTALHGSSLSLQSF